MKQKHFVPLKGLAGNKGSLAVQFIFSFMLVFGFMVGFFYLSLTLVVGELVQYGVYSSSRYLFLAHATADEQKEQAELKYIELLSHPQGKGIFKQGFFGAITAQKPFNLQNPPGVGLNDNMGFPVHQLRNLFYGVWTTYQPKGLELKVPFWGDSVKGAQPGLFDSVISSYLGREPSQEECKKFTEERWAAIKKLTRPNFPIPQNSYNSVFDNGC